MLSVFLELGKKIGIFVIVGQTIQHFGISKKYERYVKLVISIMVVAQVIFSFGIYVKQFQRQGILVSGSEYKKKWEINMDKVEEKMRDYNLMITKRMEEEVSDLEKQKEISYEENEKKEESYGIHVEKITIP